MVDFIDTYEVFRFKLRSIEYDSYRGIYLALLVDTTGKFPDVQIKMNDYSSRFKILARSNFKPFIVSRCSDSNYMVTLNMDNLISHRITPILEDIKSLLKGKEENA